jgi:hypothetical protein
MILMNLVLMNLVLSSLRRLITVVLNTVLKVPLVLLLLGVVLQKEKEGEGLFKAKAVNGVDAEVFTKCQNLLSRSPSANGGA